MKENLSRINVYSDKFKTIKIIDFEKLKQEALKLKRISEKYTYKNKILDFLDKIFGIITIIFFILIPLEILLIFFSVSHASDLLILTILYGLIYLGFLYLYVFIKKEIIEKNIIKKRNKYFPLDTPEEIINDYKAELSLKEIEKIIYIKKVLTLPSNLPSNIKYNVLDHIELYDISNNSKSNLNTLKSNLLFRAYEMKANILINYNYSINSTSTVKSKRSIDMKEIDKIETTHTIETVVSATAVKVIDENQ